MPLSDWNVTAGRVISANEAAIVQEVAGTNTASQSTVGPFQFTYNGTKADLERAVRFFVLGSDPQTNRRPFVAPGTVLDLTLPTPTQQTPAELARNAWFDKLLLLEHRLRLKNDGAVSGAQLTSLNASIAQLQSELQADALPAYATP